MPPLPVPASPMSGGPGAPGGPPVGGGIGLPKSPIGGPSGPGSSPMVSPGGGAGMQARAMMGIRKIIENLMIEAKNFPPGTQQFNAIVKAVTTLNGVFSKANPPEPAKAPLPVPAAPPMGLGGPPGGAPGGAPPPGIQPPEEM